MWVEVTRIVLIALGSALAAFLAFAPLLACSRYARAVVEGRDRAAGFWAFVAARGGSGAASLR